MFRIFLVFVVLPLAVWGGYRIVTGPPWQPSGDYGACLASHTDVTPMVTTDGQGNMSVSYIYSDVCDRHQYPHGDGPRYQAAMVTWHAKMAEYHRAHPDYKED